MCAMQGNRKQMNKHSSNLLMKVDYSENYSTNRNGATWIDAYIEESFTLISIVMLELIN